MKTVSSDFVDCFSPCLVDIFLYRNVKAIPSFKDTESLLITKPNSHLCVYARARACSYH